MPRNILHIPTKSSPLHSSALTKVLRAYIAEHFTDTHPDAFKDDLREVAKLRDQCVRMEAHASTIDLAKAYLAQLAFIVTKFPPDIDLAFPWSVAFPPTLSLFNVSLIPDDSPPTSPVSASAGPATVPAKPYAKTTANSHIIAHPNIHYERAALLFSLAAVYSHLGAQESRAEGESIKRAIAAFQAAAGTLHYLLTDVSPLLAPLFSGINARFTDADLQPAMLACLRDAMLAQAQECFWQKAVMDRLKDATIARLASRTSELYASSLDFAAGGGGIEPVETGAPKGCELPREWINHMTIKRWHFSAAAQYRKSIDDLGANRYGDELGRLKLAESYVKKALDSSRTGVSDALQSDLKSLYGVIQSDMARATKDNDLIYLEAITPATRLSAIPAAVMVEAKVPAEIANPIPYLRDSPAPAYGKPLFQELVPYGVHVAISIFDERKDSFVREEIDLQRQELDSLVASTLQSLDLPASLQALEQPIGLPPAVIRRSEEIRSEGGKQRLTALSQDVKRVAQTASGVWNEIVSTLRQPVRPFARQGDAEDSPFSAMEAQLQDRHSQQIRAFEEQLNEYSQTLEQARASDEIVQQKMREWSEPIDVLSSGQEALDQYVPGQKRAVSLTGEQNTAVRALRVELEALDDLMDARTSIYEEAKALARRHDIRANVLREAGVIASGGDRPLIIEAAHFEPLFERELAQYEPFRKEMEASRVAQEERLDVIAQRNEAFVHARSADATMKKRQAALQKLDMAYTRYREISANLVEGLNFYNAILKMLHELRENVQAWVHQRHDELADLTMRMEQASIEAATQSMGAASIADDRSLPASQSTPTAGKRRTRAQARSEQQQQGHDPQNGAQATQPPNWGAWQGGDIRFAD